MKKALLVSALLAFAAPAGAGTITITVVTAGAPCNAGQCTKTYTVPDGDLAKIIAAHGPLCQGGVAGAPSCTALQTVAFWADSLIKSTVDTVTSFYRSQAASAVVPIKPE